MANREPAKDATQVGNGNWAVFVSRLGSYRNVCRPIFCSIRKLRFEHGKRFWLNLLPLTLVHLAWGFARAKSLVFNRSVSPRATLQRTEDDFPSSG
jgi:hypothetical protein